LTHSAFATVDDATVPSRDVLYGQLLLAAVLAFPLIVAPQLHAGYSELDSAANVEASSSNLINQLFWSLVFVGALAAGWRVAMLRLAGRLWPLTAYLLWSTASILWAAAPDIVVRRLLLQIFVVGAIILPVALIADGEQVRKVVLRVMVAVLLINLAALALKPPTPLGYAGIYAQKNELGLSAALGLIACLVGAFGHRGADRLLAWIGLPIALVLLVASQSKTSLLLALAVPGIAWGIAAVARGLRLPPGLLMGCALAVGIPVGMLMVELNDTTLAGTLQFLFGDATFTGRTDIWEFAWSRIVERPVTGHGFNGFWGAGDASGALSTGSDFLASILQGHNGYLDILLETGFVGLVLFLLLLAVVLVRVGPVVMRSRSDGIFVLSFTLFAILHNGFESTALHRFHAVWLFLLLALALVAIPARDDPAAAERENSPC
jgi:O-antigen ligase